MLIRSITAMYFAVEELNQRTFILIYCMLYVVYCMLYVVCCISDSFTVRVIRAASYVF